MNMLPCSMRGNRGWRREVAFILAASRRH